MEFFTKLFLIIAVAIPAVPATATQFSRHLIPDTAAEVQENAVRALIQRTVGIFACNKFDVRVDKVLTSRSFQIKQTNDKRVQIIGSDGVSVAKGFHYYLKYHLHRDLSWTVAHIDLPPYEVWPHVDETSTSASAFIYHQNVCTWSYTFAWWDWTSWQRHIDWMAMMGISLTIAPIQEDIWHDVYLRMGLTESEINEHFAGPAFQAWERMGNIRGWAGPLPTTYRRVQKLLQQRILEAQRKLGMTVALPAFAGHVPLAMARLYPNVNFTTVERWNKFPDPYCCSLFVDPNDPLFKQIGGDFLRDITAAYGSNHIYFADPFNELQPRLAEVDYINMTAWHIYESMRAVDPSAIWMLQGWMFSYSGGYWTDELVKAFLTAVPRGRMLVLDLQSELAPQYQRTHSFYGQPFMWCMLHNFGGTLGMHGSADVINTQIGVARQMANSTMIGVGITPEGLNQNYAMYALTLERGWAQNDFDMGAWFDAFADARYGVVDAHTRTAWQLLRQSVYSYAGQRKQHGKYIVTRRPSLLLSPYTWYNASTVIRAWGQLLNAHKDIPKNHYAQYEYDLVDVTRQFLQITTDRIYVNLVSAYMKRQSDRFSMLASALLNLLDDLEDILATNVHFLLGPWLESAKRLAPTTADKELFEFNARNQITTWGPTGQILDYATKQWSGIVHDYYRPRWALFVDMISRSLTDNTSFNGTLYKEIVSNEIENPFNKQKNIYPVQGTDDTYTVSQKIFNTWTTLLQQNQTFQHYLKLHVKHYKKTRKLKRLRHKRN